MSKPPLLDCNLHDYLEIACLFRYRVRLIMTDHSVIEGKAITTGATGGEEYLALLVAGETLTLPVHRLASITALTPGARFGEIRLR
ncbi:Rho-binding antiterminator [Nitrincola alkalilacustris]|uniref:Rho-binding antiterminator n=1 Tax=Nitrincola alkalilacustris TaxID=1571224 RepID=UPI00124F0C7F|nr:Rho-binding antiterminator [Nitrincola alkalilacustris]